jgi:hypothetical protein
MMGSAELPLGFGEYPFFKSFLLTIKRLAQARYFDDVHSDPENQISLSFD